MPRATASTHPPLQRAAARSPQLPPDLPRLLHAPRTRRRTTSCAPTTPNTPKHVLMRVFAQLDGTFSTWTAQTHPRLPRESLAIHNANHPNGNHRRPAAPNPAATPDPIEQAQPQPRDPDPSGNDPRPAPPPPPAPRDPLTPEPASSTDANPALPKNETAAAPDRAGIPARPPDTTDVLPPQSERCDPPTSSRRPNPQASGNGTGTVPDRVVNARFAARNTLKQQQRPAPETSPPTPTPQHTDGRTGRQ